VEAQAEFDRISELAQKNPAWNVSLRFAKNTLNDAKAKKDK
jgi:hypothetical protein